MGVWWRKWRRSVGNCNECSPLEPAGLEDSPRGLRISSNTPTQKLKTCSRSPGPRTMGKPKSRAMGTGPSMGTIIRAPKPGGDAVIADVEAAFNRAAVNESDEIEIIVGAKWATDIRYC